MALVSSLLQVQITQALSGSSSAEQAAEGLASAYTAYAQTGQAGGASPILTGLELPRLRAPLLAALSAQNPDPSAFATAWSSGLVAFWAGVAFTGGAATSLPGAPVLAGTLSGIFMNNRLSLDAGVSALASSLDLATRTLVVIIGGVPVPFL